MTARVLVVDDVRPNVKLLETRLSVEYFEVSTASNGPEAIAICKKGGCDLVLLDVMMPGMDGFEVCRRLRASPETAYLPIILVTALDRPADRVRGLEAGADDFLTKPLDEIALIARVRSLARLKFSIDELRSRAAHGAAAGVVESVDALKPEAGGRGRILLVDGQRSSFERLANALSPHHDVIQTGEPAEALATASSENVDLMIVSLTPGEFDGLRLCSQTRSQESTRNLPILLIADREDRSKVLRGLELGVNDYLSRPVDRNELLARARTNVRQKRYIDQLRQTVRQSVEMALYDPLTGLNNRRFLETRLPAMMDVARQRGAPLTMMILDIDHFKRINDAYGHDAGDIVLKGFAAELRQIVRGGDLVCRLGGEEFVVAMPGLDATHAAGIAERARQAIDSKDFPIGDTASASITVSIGLADFRGEQDSAELYRRADRALYRSKAAGRNRVTLDAA
jgi:two-component system cell cycle response regulator